MGLFGWFKKKGSHEEEAEAPPPPAPRAAVVPPPPPEPEPADPPPAELGFGGIVASGLARLLQAQAQGMRSPGDKQLVSMLLRAVRNEGIEMPAMPADLIEIRRLLACPDTEIADMGRAVQRDPAIAAKFVSVANSPMYRGVRAVSSVNEALVRIGLNHSGMILLAIVTSSKLFRVPGYEAEAKWLHAHSLGTAVGSQYLARRVGENEQDAFMAGLLHDLGRVFILSVARDVWRDSKGQHTPSPDAVRDLSEVLHAGVSALTAQVWSYPESVVAALQHHHVPARGGEHVAMLPAKHEPLTRLVAAADLIDKTEPDAVEASVAPLAQIVRPLGLPGDEALYVEVRENADAFLDHLGVQRAPRPAGIDA